MYNILSNIKKQPIKIISKNISPEKIYIKPKHYYNEVLRNVDVLNMGPFTEDFSHPIIFP